MAKTKNTAAGVSAAVEAAAAARTESPPLRRNKRQAPTPVTPPATIRGVNTPRPPPRRRNITPPPPPHEESSSEENENENDNDNNNENDNEGENINRIESESDTQELSGEGEVNHHQVVAVRRATKAPRNIGRVSGKRVALSCVPNYIIHALQRNLADYCNVTLKDLKIISETLIKTIVEHVKLGHVVKLTNHMCFERHWRNEREFHIPKKGVNETGEMMTKAGRYVFKMRVSPALKKMFEEIESEDEEES